MDQHTRRGVHGKPVDEYRRHRRVEMHDPHSSYDGGRRARPYRHGELVSVRCPVCQAVQPQSAVQRERARNVAYGTRRVQCQKQVPCPCGPAWAAGAPGAERSDLPGHATNGDDLDNGERKARTAPLKDEAFQLNAEHRRLHQRPISADPLRRRVGIGSRRGRTLIHQI